MIKLVSLDLYHNDANDVCGWNVIPNDVLWAYPQQSLKAYHHHDEVFPRMMFENENFSMSFCVNSKDEELSRISRSISGRRDTLQYLLAFLRG